MLSRALIAAVLALAIAAPAFAADPLRDQQWGLEMVNAPGAWATSTGIGVQVAVIDTGVDRDHPDLGDRLLQGFDFVGDDPEKAGDVDSDPEDGNGHGTHVTGIIVANRDNEKGVTGVAPGAKVLPLRVLDDNGEGFVSDTVRAVERATDAGVDVINLSLGDYLPLQSALLEDEGYQEALESAAAAGIVVVVAAGNRGFPSCENPQVAGILCVGAVDRTGMRTAYSSFGSEVDLMAPGGIGTGGSSEEILSTFTGPEYYEISGTSQATPHVAGVAALLVSLGVSGQAAVDRIIETAAPATPSFQYGAGIVDAAAAVDGLAPPPPPDPDDPDAVVGSFSTKSPVKRRAVRRRGFAVTCEAARPGRCKVDVTRRGRRIARGGADVPVTQPTVAMAPLNRTGRRLVGDMGSRLRVRVTVTLPGEPARTRRVVIERPA